MRLINTRTLDFEEFEGQDVPSYAILSHRWGKEEVLFKQMITGTANQRAGFEKIRRCCLEAETFGVDYVWVDTCCIDKSSSAELSEAINSMFRWYQQSFICLVYLSDIESSPRDVLEVLGKSVWFTRGWTLQELIAPRTIEFYDSQWQSMGDMDGLRSVISQLTSIPSDVLAHKWPLRRYSIAQRMSWAAERQTTRVEDRAYSLLGIFDIHMPLLYGEGENAFRRLQEEIVKRNNDPSILLWTGKPLSAFAPSPAAFSVVHRLHSEILRVENLGKSKPCFHLVNDGGRSGGLNTESSTVTNIGLSLSIPLFPWYFNTYLGLIAVMELHNCSSWYCFIYLSRSSQDSRLFRTSWEGEAVKYVSRWTFQDRLYCDKGFHQISSHMRRVVIASEPYTSWPSTIDEYRAPGTVNFVLNNSTIWGLNGYLQPSDVISRNVWDPETSILYPESPCELLGIFQIVRPSGRKRYLYIGYDEEFHLCLALGSWCWPHNAYGTFRSISTGVQSDTILSVALQPTTFWSWLQGSAPKEVEWAVKAKNKPLSHTTWTLDDLGLLLQIHCSAVGSYIVSFTERRSSERRSGDRLLKFLTKPT